MHRQSAARRLAALVASASIAMAMSLQMPVATRAAHSDSSASSSGDAGCMGWIQEAPCQDWDTQKPEGGHDWIYVDEASYSNGGSLATRQTFDVHEEYTIGGAWRSTTLKGSMAASNSGGGRAGNTLDYDLAVETPGPQVSVTGTITASADGSEYVLGIAEASILIECGGVEFTFDREIDAGSGYRMSDSGSFSPSASVDSDGNSCDVEFYASVGATTNQKAPGDAGSVQLEFDLTFSSNVIEGCDGFEGIVTDGAPGPDEHPLNGIRVQLHRNGSPVGEPVATAEDGFYCMPASEAAPPGDYQLRATLIDQLHQPPLFETRRGGDAAALFAEVPVHAETFGGPEQVRVSFADTSRTWAARVANIHYESERFVRWLTDTLGWSPSTIRPFVIRTYHERVTQYLRGSREVLISEDDSAHTARDQADDIAPDNGEWHEIGHHLAASLGVAVPTAAACLNRVNHAGWLNPSTCDSIGEGFPTFLSVLGSLAIDAGREAGYATTNYAGMVDLEAHGLFPWSIQYSDDYSASAQREDMAVAQLLWDLADDTPTEEGRIYLAGPEEEQLILRDEIAIGGAELVDLMATFQVNTVEDLYRAAAGSSLIPPAAATPSVDLDEDGEPDISALDAVFLLHGFHPVEDEALPAFRLGDAFPRTDHVPASDDALVPRSHVEQVPGSFIRLQNGTAEAVTFSAEVAGIDGDAPFQVRASVPANSTDLLYLEVAPYYRSIIKPGDALPACSAPGSSPRAISITAPGMETRTLDTCEYLHLVVASIDGAALTVSVGTGSFGASPAPSASESTPDGGTPTAAVDAVGLGGPVIAAVAGIAAAVLIGLLFLRRRRPG